MPTPKIQSKAVLVTGCSSGIGRATAERLAERGWTVYATARRPESIADLEEKGCRLLQLDVTDEQSMRAAVGAIEAEHGAVGVLINNAGYSQSGAIETVGIDDVRRQFETNVFGLVRLTQLALPKMRAQRWGKIVNVSSMGGELHVPRRRHLPREQVRARGDQRRAALRGQGVRRRRRRDPAGRHPHRLRRRRRRLDRGRRQPSPGRTGASTTRRRGDPRTPTRRARCRSSAAGPRTSRRRSSARSAPAARRSATA